MSEALTSAYFENLKTLRSVTLRLAPFTVIIGRNGVGKTSVLDGIDLAVTATRSADEPRGVFVGQRSLDRLASRCGVEHVSLKLTSRSQTGFVGAIPDGTPRTESERWWREGGWSIRWGMYAGQAPWGPSTILRLETRRLASPSAASTGGPILSPLGDGLATVLNHYIGRRRDPTFGRILESLREVVPEVEDLETEPTEVVRHVEEIIRIDNDALTRQREERLPGHKLLLHMRGGVRIAADEASEGTLLALGILTALYSSGASIVLIDDLDRALHPEAQLKLVASVRRIVETTGVQVIATAHSPVVLMGMRDEEIVHLERDERGATRVLDRVGGSPGWMTGTEILDRYFGITRVALSRDVQRYALLAGDPTRTDRDEAELVELRDRLRAAGLEPDITPVARDGA